VPHLILILLFGLLWVSHFFLSPFAPQQIFIKIRKDNRMKIEVEAKLILTVPNPQKRTAGEIVLAAENHINVNAGLLLMLGGETKVGIRIHTKSYKEK